MTGWSFSCAIKAVPAAIRASRESARRRASLRGSLYTARRGTRPHERANNTSRMNTRRGNWQGSRDRWDRVVPAAVSLALLGGAQARKIHPDGCTCKGVTSSRHQCPIGVDWAISELIEGGCPPIQDRYAPMHGTHRFQTLHCGAQGMDGTISATCSLGATTPSVDHVEIVNNGGDYSPSRFIHGFISLSRHSFRCRATARTVPPPVARSRATATDWFRCPRVCPFPAAAR
jgi:hypothetical protein